MPYFGDGSNLSDVPGVPSGAIILWSGASNAIPSGYVLCDGNNNTPNLQDRFVVGAGNTYAVDATGGSADATLVSHTHNLLYNHGSFGGSSGAVTPRSGNTPVTPGISGRVSTEGSSATNANLPPYYALAYIIKT
jgi:microcystin-dependent protein